MENTISESSAEALDILEQLESVNEMIDIHGDDDFMREQYESRKKEITEMLFGKLKDFKIDIRSIAA